MKTTSHIPTSTTRRARYTLPSNKTFEPTSVTSEAIRSIPFPDCEQTRIHAFPSQRKTSYLIGVHRLSNPAKEDGRFVIRNLNESGSHNFSGDSLQCVKKIASDMGIRQLVTQEKLPLFKGNDLPALIGAGFKPIDESITLRVPFTLFARRATRIAKALAKKNKIPPGYKVVPIKEVSNTAMKILHESGMMDDYDFRNKFKGDSLKSFSQDHCLSVLFMGEMVGIILVAKHTEVKTYEILIRWVEKNFRGSWVNAVLINEAVRQGLEIDIDFLCFNANSERHQETLHLAKNAGAEIIAKSRRYSITLNS